MSDETKVAVITGAGSGIGRACAFGLLRNGTNVVALDIDESALKSLASDSTAKAGELVVRRTDVGCWDAADETVSWVCQKFGRLDHLINSAGVVHFDTFEGHARDDWNRMHDVNVLGTVGMCRAVIPVMRRRRSGRIVNIASWFGKIGKANYAAYCASKFAVIGLSQSLAHEVAGDGITVNTVCPGTIDGTAMRIYSDAKAKEAGLLAADERVGNIPIPRLGQPEDVWNAIRFLLQPESSYVTGQSLNITGGLWLN